VIMSLDASRNGPNVCVGLLVTNSARIKTIVLDLVS
jgi:hypothetical protein